MRSLTFAFSLHICDFRDLIFIECFLVAPVGSGCFGGGNKGPATALLSGDDGGDEGPATASSLGKLCSSKNRPVVDSVSL